MKPKVYLETTIPSYLTARPSRDLITAAHQDITRDWWDKRRDDFVLFVSQAVIQEASAGDADAAARRLEALTDVPVLTLTKDAKALAKRLMKRLALPPHAALDSLHIALAVVHDMDYLLTWNCAHIANAAFRHRIEAVCRGHGRRSPVICTPQELLEE